MRPVDPCTTRVRPRVEAVPTDVRQHRDRDRQRARVPVSAIRPLARETSAAAVHRAADAIAGRTAWRACRCRTAAPALAGHLMKPVLDAGLHVLCAGVAAAIIQPGARAASTPLPPDQVLERFLALDHAPLTQYRALRHFEARNETFNSIAWMNVWTEADSRGYRSQIASEGGSDYIRNRVFKGTLATEERSWTSNAHERAAVTAVNYVFNERTIQPDGCVRVMVTPRRKDLLLVDGWIVLHPETADLVRVEGQLSKSPSFWARGVHVVRHYERIGGVRVPVALETTSRILIAGRSTLTIRWEYESVNGDRVGTPMTPAAPAESGSSRRGAAVFPELVDRGLETRRQLLGRAGSP